MYTSRNVMSVMLNQYVCLIQICPLYSLILQIRAGQGLEQVYLSAFRKIYHLDCLLIPRCPLVWGVRATTPWLNSAECLAAQHGWRVGAVLLSAHHLALLSLCLGKRSLPGLNYGGIIQDTLKQLQPHINQYALG